jgi:transcriptional regulator with XRE-family HTH domain
MKSGLPAIHPGEFLKEILEDRRVSQAQFARAIGVAPMRVSHVGAPAAPALAAAGRQRRCACCWPAAELSRAASDHRAKIGVSLQP